MVVKALQWDDQAEELVEVVANATTIVGTPRRWTPTPGQQDKYEDSISVIRLVEMSATVAVTQVLESNADKTVHAIELEEEDGRPWWQVELVDASGVKSEVSIRAD